MVTRTMLRRGLAPLCTLVAFLTLASSAQATPPDVFGYGSRSTSLAGAVSASVDDISSVYYNPAGIARSGALQLQLGYFSQSPFVSLNGTRSNVERHGATHFGLIAPATFGDFRVAFGMGIQLPDQRVARTRSAIVDRPRWELYDTRSHRLYLSTHLAIRPVEWLTLGGGLVFQSASELTLDIRGDIPLGGDAELQSRLEHQFKGDLTSIRYFSFGAQIAPHPRVNIGIVYRQAVELSNTIIALANATVAGSIPLDFSLISAATSLYGPHQVSLAVDFRPIERLMIALELTYARWSAHPSLIADQTITLETPVLVLGDIEALPPLPMNMHDTWVPRIGMEYSAITGDVGLDLRLGYAYENSPYPTQSGVLNFVDNNKHTLSLGFGLNLNNLRPTLPGRLSISGHFAMARLTPRDHIKTSLADPVGDYRSEGYLVAAGVDVTVAFE